MKRLAMTLGILALSAVPGGSQQEDAQETRVALAWHRLTGEPIDFQRVAERSAVVRRASNFDRPDVLRAELARLEQTLASADPAAVFTMQINDRISEYDHGTGEFSITLFQPGYYIPLRVFDQEYQVVFANAESARPIPMPRDEAREFDARLNRAYRAVLTEARFRIIGQGDPSGAVTGARVVRAELLEARVLDRQGSVLHVPTVVPVSALATAPAFDGARADVAGFRVGVPLRDLEATFERLFGGSARSTPRGATPWAGQIQVNAMGCMNIPGRPEAEPGAVCVTAWYDADEVVRAIRVERVFAPLDGEVVRKALVAKYGAVGGATGRSGFTLGWGDTLPQAFGTTHTLTATYGAHESMMGRGMNRIPDIKIVLHLVDAAWASRQSP